MDMIRRADIIVYVISFLLLIGAASLWWQGVFPFSDDKLVLLPENQVLSESSSGFEPGENDVLNDETDQKTKDEQGSPHESDKLDVDVIFVHVAGAVESPGVYKLTNGQRIYEVLELACPLESANLDYLNLAQVLRDQDKVYVPKQGETAAPNGGGSGEIITPQPKFPININTATLSELELLPGIGPSKAAAIIEFRNQSGGFSHKQDLKKVSGIGDVTYAKLEALITIR